jgi:predicted RNase H-like nuclease (RuvC/YqgF family)
MKNWIALLLCVSSLSSISLGADDSEVQALRKQVQELTERVKKLESLVAPLADKTEAEGRIEKQRVKARERMRKDLETYDRTQLREIESLYQVANQRWQTEEGKNSLKDLIKKYDKANRTGCALLYLGQMSEAAEKEEYLQKAIADFSDCWYGDGV